MTRPRMLLAVLHLLAAGAPIAAQPLSVPRGGDIPVLVDGQLAPGEWADAAAHPLDSGFTLLLKQRGGHVFLAVRAPDTAPRPVDIFLLTDDGTLNQLHASAAIGERRLPGLGWSDTTAPAWRWGNHVGWIASEAKLDSERPRELPAGQRMFRSDGVEFQIRRSRFPGARWRVRIEVGSFPGNGNGTAFPTASTRASAEGWAVLVLGGEG